MNKRFSIQASVIASLIIFGYHGYKMASAHTFSTEEFSEKMIVVAIITSAAYFYFLSIAASYIFSLDLKSKTNIKMTLIIEVVQLLAYFYIWDALKFDSLIPYAWVLVIINCTYIIWDILHWKNNFSGKTVLKTIFFADLAGLILSTVFLLLILSGNLPLTDEYNKPNTEKAISVSIWSTVIILQSVFGIICAIIVLVKKQNQIAAAA